MTIKELYEYAKENGIEDKQLVAVCFENGCVLVDDEYPLELRTVYLMIEIGDNLAMIIYFAIMCVFLVFCFGRR